MGLKNYLPYFSTKTCVVGTQKNRLIEAVLLSIHNTCLNWGVRKYLQFYAQKNPYPDLWIHTPMRDSCTHPLSFHPLNIAHCPQHLIYHKIYYMFGEFIDIYIHTTSISWKFMPFLPDSDSRIFKGINIYYFLHWQNRYHFFTIIIIITTNITTISFNIILLLSLLLLIISFYHYYYFSYFPFHPPPPPPRPF